MFYGFNQNNSGGVFKINKNVTVNVFIEADSANKANDIAESVGIYFDGVAVGRDCDCCGDRWYKAYKDDGEKEPMIDGTPVADYKESWVKKGDPYAHVYNADGTKVTYYR